MPMQHEKLQKLNDFNIQLLYLFIPDVITQLLSTQRTYAGKRLMSDLLDICCNELLLNTLIHRWLFARIKTRCLNLVVLISNSGHGLRLNVAYNFAIWKHWKSLKLYMFFINPDLKYEMSYVIYKDTAR